MQDSGIVNLFKPSGISSHQATKKVQKILGANKAGHVGTLDPFAEGILPVCINDATRIAEYILDFEKEYRVLVRLGMTTDTYDITGRDVERGKRKTGSEKPEEISRDELEGVLGRFRGRILQEPPMYSAIKVKGVPLYRMARMGLEVKRAKREVEIYSLKLTGYSPPDFIIAVRCSKGTYIRSLAHDTGEMLGTGAIVVRLERVAVGEFNEESAVSFEDLERGSFGLITMDDALRHLRKLVLTDEQFSAARHGARFQIVAENNLKSEALKAEELLRLKSPDGVLFAIGIAAKSGEVKIRKLFAGSLSL